MTKYLRIFFNLITPASKRLRFISTIFLALILLACDPLPKDPNHTYSKLLQGQALKVGVVLAPKFCEKKDSNFSGLEVELLKAFAHQLGTRAEFKDFSVEDGFKQLKEEEIDILIGGFTKKNPYKNFGYTRPYYQEHVMAVVRGENRLLTSLEKFLKSEAKQYIEDKNENN